MLHASRSLEDGFVASAEARVNWRKRSSLTRAVALRGVHVPTGTLRTVLGMGLQMRAVGKGWREHSAGVQERSFHIYTSSQPPQAHM